MRSRLSKLKTALLVRDVSNFQRALEAAAVVPSRWVTDFLENQRSIPCRAIEQKSPKLFCILFTILLPLPRKTQPSDSGTLNKESTKGHSRVTLESSSF